MKSKRIPLNQESQKIIKRQLEEFRKKFGRDPGAEDPLFFDPDADTPEPYPQEKFDAQWNELLNEAVRAAGLPPELAYAAKKTGRLVTTENKKHLTKAELKEWNDAIQEFLDGANRRIQ